MMNRLVEFGKEKRNIKKNLILIKIEGRRGAADILKYEQACEENKNKNTKENKKEKENKSPARGLSFCRVIS